MSCIPASFALNNQGSSEFGTAVEWLASISFRFHTGRVQFFPAPPARDFFDIQHGFGNTSLYANFLRHHHPWLSVSALTDMSSNRLLKIPDFMTLGPPAEYYDVKPNSKAGLRAGDDKIGQIAALCAFYGLPYVPGTAWKPDFEFPLYDGELLGIAVKVYVRVRWLKPGLVVHEVCAEGKTRPLTNQEIVGIVGLCILGMFLAVASDGTILPWVFA